MDSWTQGRNPQPFPVVNLDTAIFGPMWTQIDSTTGTVIQKTYDSGKEIQKINKDIKPIRDEVSDFNPVYVTKVIWENVMTMASSGPANKETVSLTVQLVHVILIY